MEEKEINANESLAIINAMIDTAKNKLADDGFYFIFWGWLVSISSLTHYFCLKAGIENGHWVWIILMPLGGIISAFWGWRSDKAKKVKTYIDSYIGYIWGGILCGMLIALFLMKWNGFRHTYFFLMILYAIGSFITGGLLRFRPLIVGSLFSFAIAVLSVFTSDQDQFLCIAGALLSCYIIPGHMLRAAYKSQHV